jgi:hypothetical protein
MKFTIIVRDAGTDRTYHCSNKEDAMRLLNMFGRDWIDAELWEGATLVRKALDGWRLVEV